jgi:Ca2+-transporting ATPase
VPQAVRTAHAAGIRIVMITGDAPATALAVARRIGLSAERAVVGSELERADDAEVLANLEGDVVFARTTPEHKLRIVEILQRAGHVVGMTGDGVNDAPALKRADIGIAMGLRGTDVAKGAADLVLTDDDFATIVGAVEEGRRQFDNIRKFVGYLLSSNTGEVIAIVCNVLLGGPLIFAPVQILWVNLVTDGITAVALGLEPAERGVMQRPPRAPREPVLDRAGLANVGLLGAYVGVATLALFQLLARGGAPGDEQLARTTAFAGLIALELVNVFNFRSLRAPLLEVGLFSNRWLLAGWAATFALLLAAVYAPPLQALLDTAPLGWREWGWIALASAPILLVSEAVKLARWRARPQPA